MGTANLQEQFSADVRCDLLVNGLLIPIAKMGPGYAVLQTPGEIPAGESAVLIMKVDGREHRWEIVLDDGVVPFGEEFTFRVLRYPPQELFNPFLS